MFSMKSERRRQNILMQIKPKVFNPTFNCIMRSFKTEVLDLKDTYKLQRNFIDSTSPLNLPQGYIKSIVSDVHSHIMRQLTLLFLLAYCCSLNSAQSSTKSPNGKFTIKYIGIIIDT